MLQPAIRPASQPASRPTPPIIALPAVAPVLSAGPAPVAEPGLPSSTAPREDSSRTSVRVVVAVADEPAARDLRILFASQGFSVVTVASVGRCLEAIHSGAVDLVVVGWSLSGGDALEVCRHLRDRQGVRIPVMVLAASGRPEEAYECFEAGARDYLRMPLDPLEVLWRARAHLHQASREESGEQLVVGNLTLDLRNHLVIRGAGNVAVTPSECAILRHLMAEPGRAVAIETLLVEALGYPPRLGNPEIVRTHVRNLRQKLEADPRNPALLVNRPRVGYVLKGPGLGTEFEAQGQPQTGEHEGPESRAGAC